ncbi:hypothetical protein Tco_0246147, partial [Tanacetum coccineum]
GDDGLVAVGCDGVTLPWWFCDDDVGEGVEGGAAEVIMIWWRVAESGGVDRVTCVEAGHKFTSLASERDRLASEDFKERMEIQQEQQAQELYNRVAELEAHVMDVSGRLEGEFYPTYLTTLVGRRWLLTHGIQIALLKCLKSPEYQGILGHALGQAVDFDFPLVSLLKSKKDAGMDEVLDCFLLDGPLAGLPEAAYLQPCIEQLSVPIHHAGDTTAVGETSLSFASMNVHARAEGPRSMLRLSAN